MSRVAQDDKEQLADTIGNVHHLVNKLGALATSDAGANPNGTYRLVEIRHDGDKYTRVLVESNCGAEQVGRAVAAALAELARGRR